MRYTQAEILNDVNDCINNKGIEKLYDEPCVNRHSKTKDTKRFISEIISEFLLKKENLDLLNGINSIRREKSYQVKSKFHEEGNGSNCEPRSEKQIVKAMINKDYHFLGKIIDREIPLPNTEQEGDGKGLGEIDLLSYDYGTGIARIIEFKRPSNGESILRCILEIYTYSKIVDQGKLVRDFNEGKNLNISEIKSALLVYKNGKQYNQYKIPELNNLRNLIKELEIETYCCDGDGADLTIEKF